MNIFRSLVGVLFGLLLFSACQPEYSHEACLIAGDPNCQAATGANGREGSTKSAADGVVVSYPVQASGDDIVTNFYAYGQIRGIVPARTVVESMLTSTGEVGIDLPEPGGSVIPRSLAPATVDTVISPMDAKGVSIRTSIGNPGRKFQGCLGGAAADSYKTLKIMQKGQSEPVFDAHSIYYRHPETGQRCWALYMTGKGINGPGFCTCWDDMDPPSSVSPSVKTAMIIGTNQMRAEARQALPQWGFSQVVATGILVVAFDIIIGTFATPALLAL